MVKPTKRKMYQKRRKKEKAERRRKDTQSILPAKSIAAFYKYNHKVQNEQQATNKNNEKDQNFAFSPISSYSRGLQLWWQTYCSAIEFHKQQQKLWQNNRRENYSALLEKYANEYETSSEEEDEDELQNAPNTYEGIESTNKAEESVDEEYIKFLEITHKHQEEIRLKRAKESS